MNKRWVDKEFSQAFIRDERLTNRVIDVVKKLDANPQATLPQALGGWQEAKACYRMLDNENISHEILLSGHRIQTIERMKNYDTVLNIQDTTHLDFSHHPDTDGLGAYCEFEDKIGMLLHSSLVVSTEGVALGLLHQKYWSREPKDPDRDYNKLPIEEKESYKWLETMDKSLMGVSTGTRVINVCDREADIYEFFQYALSKNHHLLVRMTQNRRIINDNADTILQLLKESQVQAEIVVDVPRNSRQNIGKRQARLTVKYEPVLVRPPKGKTSTKGQPDLPLYVVTVEEISTPPKGVKPISWYLITDIIVDSIETAIEVVGWYKQRWKIERFHYILKSGCNIDEIQLGTGDRLENAIALYSVIAWKILYLTYEARVNPQASCTLIFKEHEWQALYCYVNETAVPPKEPPSLQGAMKMVGHLGGFLGRKSDGDPGVRVIWKGMARLHDIANMWSLLTKPPVLSKDKGKA
jgi:hypothetical protein